MIRKTRKSVARASLHGLSGLALAASLHGTAHADASTAAAPLAAADGDIIVTATRREEKAKDVPIALTTISGATLDALNSSGLDIRFLSSRTPSLQIESSFGRTFPRFYIRGLGNTDYDPNAAQPVSVVYDDVALENPMLKSFPVFDLAQVEVLRGPQGTLFGRNTPAGVVKLDSAKPDQDSFGGYGSLEYGIYNTINGEAAINAPLGGGFALRTSGLVQHRENWVTNTNYGQPGSVAPAKLEGYTDVAARVQLAYVAPDDDTHVLLNLHGRRLNGTPCVFRAGLFVQGSNEFSPGFNPKDVQLDGFTSQTLRQFGWNVHLDHHFDGLGTFYSVTAYEHARVESTGDIDGGATYPDAFPALGLNNALFPDNTGGVTKPSEYSQELRFATEQFSGFRLQTGAYFFHQTLTYSEFDYVGPPYTTRAADQDQDIEHNDKNENIGVFGSGEYNTGALTLRAGVRYSHDNKRDTVSGYSSGLSGKYITDLMATAPSGKSYPFLAPLTARVTGGDTTWDASATYAVSPAINVYGRVATGYLGPAIQDRVTFGSLQNTVGKQTTISAEGGIKGSLFDHRVSFSIDGYWTRTKDMTLTEVGGVGNSATLVTVPRVLGHGAEGEFDAKLLPGLTLTASGSYNYTKLEAGSLSIPGCGSGACTVTDPIDAATGNAYINGNPLPQAPKWIGNFVLRYEVPVNDTMKVFAMTDWAYRSSINYLLYTAKEFTGRSLTEGGVKIGFETKNGLEVAVFGRNILNQVRAIGTIDFDNLTGMINDPRILGGSIRKTF